MPSAIILVVEDEPLLRMAAIDMVESAGFTAMEAADATQAVEILQSRTDISIVFTDIDMPGGIDGLRLAAAIRNRWPPIHVIITSGHTKPPRGSLPSDMVFFSKPYRENEVVATMMRMAA